MDGLHNSPAFVKSAFLKNPILVRAIGIGPVVGAAITLKHGISLSIIMTVLLFGSCLFGSFIGKLIPERFHAPANIVLSAILLIPSYLAAEFILPGGVVSLSVFAPLMMVNSILGSYVSNSFVGSFGEKIGDALGNAAGFTAVTLIISSIREILVSGTIFGMDIHAAFTVPALKLPFTGFILLGFAAALCKSLRVRYAAGISPKGGERA